MGSAGLGVAGVDVTGTGAYTVGAAGAGKATITEATDTAAATVIIQTKTTGKDFEGTSFSADAFTGLEGTISFAGKSLDLSSVDYSNADGDNNAATTGTDAQHLAVLNKAAASAFGLATGATPFGATADKLTFTTPANVAGYTDAGALGTTSADIAKATPTFAAASGATSAISALDKAVKSVSTTRADLGAIQNRFDHTINNLNVAVENLTASESRIRDADMAQEMVQFTRNQILSQAGTAMLAQANQASQGVLSLLR
jgi:flagellin-like hook-associated protein FlgL